MQEFARVKALKDSERRVALSGGSPGLAVTLDIDVFQKRRAAMVALLKTGAGVSTMASWLPVSEAMGRSRTEKLESYLKLLYELLRDITILSEGSDRPIRNVDARNDLNAIAGRVSRAWIINAVKGVDEVAALLRRNIQKSIALDGLLMRMRSA
jgi:DNA polymerase-3 subunit delta'